MNWHLYRKDDPNTWPEIDCTMLVYVDDKNYHEFLTIAKWGTWCNMMYDIKTEEYLYADEYYYKYIGYVPNGYRVFEGLKCQYTDKYGWKCACPYGFDDDGYCTNDAFKCEHSKIVTEYAINDNKRIWKEFE